MGGAEKKDDKSSREGRLPRGVRDGEATAARGTSTPAESQPRSRGEKGNEEAHHSRAQMACISQKKATHTHKKRMRRVGKRTDENHMRTWRVMAAIVYVWGVTLATVAT